MTMKTIKATIMRHACIGCGLALLAAPGLAADKAATQGFLHGTIETVSRIVHEHQP